VSEPVPDAPDHDEQVCVFAPSTIVTVTIEAGEEDDEVHFHAGGQGFWIARLLGRLGVPTVLSTVLGGESGRVARALVAAEQIELRAVETSIPNGCWVHDRRSGERTTLGENVGRPLDRHVADELYGATLAAALDARICVLAGPHRPGLIGADVYRRLTSDLRENGVTVIADLSGEFLLAALDAGVEFCKASDEDLRETDGFDAGDDPVTHLRRLVRSGGRRAVITRGAEPSVAHIDGREHLVVTPELEPIDHRGAGDAFTALIAAARYWNLDWEEAVCWGAAAGALTVVRRGLATADRREIHQLLNRVRLEDLDDRWTEPSRPRKSTEGYVKER
jgi:1-phosphofructokinase